MVGRSRCSSTRQDIALFAKRMQDIGLAARMGAGAVALHGFVSPWVQDQTSEVRQLTL